MKPIGYFASNSKPVYDLLARNISIESLQNKYLNNNNVIAFRVHGLLGDCIKFSTIVKPLLRCNSNTKMLLLMTDVNESHCSLYTDIFKYLIKKNIIIDLFYTTHDVIDKDTVEYSQFFSYLGFDKYYNISYPSFNFPVKPEEAYLGFDNKTKNDKKISLFRYSGFHTHFPRRHIPEDKWLKIEEYLINKGYDVYLYGYDDTMKTLIPPDKDYRKKLSVIGTLISSSDSSLVISTTTYFPLYHHHFIPCIVFADPNDTLNLKNIWRSNNNYIIVDTVYYNPVEFVKNYMEGIIE